MRGTTGPQVNPAEISLSPSRIIVAPDGPSAQAELAHKPSGDVILFVTTCRTSTPEGT